MFESGASAIDSGKSMLCTIGTLKEHHLAVQADETKCAASECRRVTAPDTELGEEGKKRKIICIGDYENDISMFDHVDVSYAVEDAFDAVKERATRVTVPFDQDAIAALIADIENGRI